MVWPGLRREKALTAAAGGSVIGRETKIGVQPSLAFGALVKTGFDRRLRIHELSVYRVRAARRVASVGDRSKETRTRQLPLIQWLGRLRQRAHCYEGGPFRGASQSPGSSLEFEAFFVVVPNRHRIRWSRLSPDIACLFIFHCPRSCPQIGPAVPVA
jgi:hypothetical protein